MSEDVNIRALRERLVEARTRGDVSVVVEVADSVRLLAENQYRCCLVDYESCRPAFYVRVLGFENGRIKAALEFPIEPRLRAVQWIPLSHLADCQEAENEARVREIYAEMASYVHHKTAGLLREVAAFPSGSRKRTNANGRVSGNGVSVNGVRGNGVSGNGSALAAAAVKPATRRRKSKKRRNSLVNTIGWCLAGLLFSLSLVLVTS